MFLKEKCECNKWKSMSKEVLTFFGSQYLNAKKFNYFSLNPLGFPGIGSLMWDIHFIARWNSSWNSKPINFFKYSTENMLIQIWIAQKISCPKLFFVVCNSSNISLYSITPYTPLSLWSLGFQPCEWRHTTPIASFGNFLSTTFTPMSPSHLCTNP